MTDLLKLSGGKKQHWLRTHRDEVLAYYEAHGEAATRDHFNIVNPIAWRNFLNPGVRGDKGTKLTKADKAIARAEITEEAVKQLRQEIGELRESYSRFVPFLANELTHKFFVPLLAGKIEIPAELEYKPAADPLALNDFRGKSKK